jgi:hypothetical protein
VENEEEAMPDDSSLTPQVRSEDALDYIDVLFDGPPSHEGGRFVEVENPKGESIDAGEWSQRRTVCGSSGSGLPISHAGSVAATKRLRTS